MWSSPSQATQMLRVASPLHGDLRCGLIDVPQILRCQLSVRCPNVLVQALKLRCPWDRNDPWFLGEQPTERKLRGRYLLARSDRGKHVYQCLVRLARLRREPRQAAAEVGAVEGR